MSSARGEAQRVPQVMVTLNPVTGELQMMLPGCGGLLRGTELREATAGQVLKRVLQDQLQRGSAEGARLTIGIDAEPTQAQVREWEAAGRAVLRAAEGISGADVGDATLEELGL